ncbi:werner helicase interacting protein 1 [Lichtheimia corymbifera JMRC:FSU:9682]|uniref:Werner helicase interacting protein 1 n=1 Tax=Lichtheimia corymbifera JMRC:FSU:9682 TaxID=1263082 RepID=A0A068S9T2_9FUNG|nr:werner helicase interacting protein 1 [Lichtheimia corymbifera JMRC:FSU:9682]
MQVSFLPQQLGGTRNYRERANTASALLLLVPNSTFTMNKVECPICSQLVPSSSINAHIDSGCSTAAVNNTSTEGTTKQSQLSFSSSDTKKPVKMAPLFSTKRSNEPPTKSSPTTSIPKPNKPAQTPSSSSSSNSTSTSPQMKRMASESGTSTTPENTKKQRRDPSREAMPLAAKVRPASLSEFVGQEELLGENGVLRTLMQCDRIPSMVLWGPPGCGKTTVARIISKMTKSRFVELSATSHGAADVKKAFEGAKGHLSLTGQKTIVFIDEIHRFTKAQQDLFLPYVEQGTIHLIGATTENPSFKVNSALLSRCRVFVLQRLSEEELQEILSRALEQWRQDEPLSLTEEQKKEENEALSVLAVYSDGDARNAINTLEVALSVLPSKASPLSPDIIKGAFQKSHLLYDRNGEQHYNIISALHKSVRGSDANAALYWLGRMLEAGEDPLYVARRMVRMASEDIGMADSAALPLAMSAYHACEKIGMPECDTILAHVATYLAETKKSVRTYKAYNKVKEVIRQQPNYPVPMHIRNAPTKLMKNLGYGDGYKYNPDYDEPVDQTYLPDELKDTKFLDE